MMLCKLCYQQATIKTAIQFLRRHYSSQVVLISRVHANYSHSTNSEYKMEKPIHFSRARVMDTWMESPTVRGIQLNLLEPFNFKAGQWVDTLMPGVERMGGYSPCSSPNLLPSLTLAVRSSEHPPSKWLFSKCAKGDEVRIRSGGDFCIDLSEAVESGPRYLLVAGGVGLNPLLAMLRHLDHQASTLQRPPCVALVYSARTEGDLLFKNMIDDIVSRQPSFKSYFITSDTDGRINKSMLKDVLRKLSNYQEEESSLKDVDSESVASCELSSIEAYVCGPPGMIEDVEKWLVDLQVGKVEYEKWW